MCVHPVGRCVSTVLLITVSFCSLLVEDGGAATGRFGWMRWCLSSSVAVVGFLKFSLMFVSSTGASNLTSFTKLWEWERKTVTVKNMGKKHNSSSFFNACHLNHSTFCPNQVRNDEVTYRDVWRSLMLIKVLVHLVLLGFNWLHITYS